MNRQQLFEQIEKKILPLRTDSDINKIPQHLLER